MKMHFAEIERTNESHNHEYSGPTLCGLVETDSPSTDRIEHVTCKTCNNLYSVYQQRQKEMLRKEFQSVNTMAFYLSFCKVLFYFILSIRTDIMKATPHTEKNIQDFNDTFPTVAGHVNRELMSHCRGKQEGQLLQAAGLSYCRFTYQTSSQL
jgi:hypothetical protein